MPSVTTTTVVRHRIFLPEGGNGFGDGGPPLADRAIDTQDILAALIQDGVDCDGGFARLPVSEDQLSLTAPDGNERIDDFNSGLERHRDGRPIHDGRGRAFDRQVPAFGHRPVAVKGSAERVDDASQQPVAHDHVHDPARAPDFIPRVEMPVFAEQHDPDLFRVHVECDAEHIAGKHHQFIKADAGKARDTGDARGNAGNRAHLP